MRRFLLLVIADLQQFKKRFLDLVDVANMTITFPTK